MSNQTVEVPGRILDLARSAGRVVVLTGAGMSAESGVPTFRDIATGLWSQFSESDLATAEALAEHPGTVWAWYAWRATTIRHVAPNAGHVALATWQRHRRLDIVTQNVDDLHERAGAAVLSHVHGSIFDVRCAHCGLPGHEGYPELQEPVERIDPPACERCGGGLRPGGGAVQRDAACRCHGIGGGGYRAGRPGAGGGYLQHGLPRRDAARAGCACRDSRRGGQPG